MRTSSPLRAVLLDAGNTLVFVDPAKLLPIFREEGIDVDLATFRRAEREARLELVRHLPDGVRGTETSVWRRYFLTLFRAAGVPDEVAAGVGRRVRTVHRDEHLWTRVEEGTGEALERLRASGLRLGVVSNSDGRIEDLLERKGLRRHFEVILDSEKVGVEKPDPAIFHMALERLEDVGPSEALYVGDLYPVDVVGARAAGLRALLVDPYGAFRERDVDRIDSVAELPSLLQGTSGGEG